MLQYTFMHCLLVLFITALTSHLFVMIYLESLVGEIGTKILDVGVLCPELKTFIFGHLKYTIFHTIVDLVISWKSLVLTKIRICFRSQVKFQKKLFQNYFAWFPF